MRESKAYGLSIYLMLGAPITSLSVFGLLVYRGVKKNAQLLACRTAGQAGPPEVQSCPKPSTAEGS